MSAPTALITGTSSGIGLEIAVGAARAGWRAVATMRDVSRADALRRAADAAGVADLVEVRRLDVVDPASVTACVAGVIADRGRLDAVVNNAGAGHVGTLEEETVDDVRAVMEVNFFGVLHVSRAALPHLRASRGRLVTVTSVGGVVGQPFNEAYCAAKFAVEGFMEALAPVAATVGVLVTVVEPGAVASEFVANVGVDRDAAVAQAGVYAPALRAYLDRTAGAFAAAQSPADAAAAVVATLTDPEPAPRVQTSTTARQFVGAKLADLDGRAVATITAGWLA
ncbi:SDR family NAD(P)-dependent oxidoreductase [Micromonospora sp. 4G57]|uniref:SDR family NAD(P)-dependent oxidoreductase n=1 Tax=Micromonospora sicca TaxID=2202420 RepID=A0ABU5J8D3_9ACTN|nr:MULTISPECIES: SDR family NAD(P)-dependent oxidoreductase [unclassified Micromonospora]MDZ5443683.1 SDR family NAD(P)-dependent oxidoreductase [Micromonospora sp. 4G57]MDZ5488845.1 SDR family NAD(P)-dependent oxidoreductase [Micromonospora sp. 4G53]